MAVVCFLPDVSIRFCINRLGLAVYIQIYIHKVFDEPSYYIGVGIIFAIIV